VDSDSVR